MRLAPALAFAYLCGCSSILGLNEPVIAERLPHVEGECDGLVRVGHDDAGDQV